MPGRQGRDMALTGDLAEFTLEHVLRLLALSERSGTLTIRSAEGRVTIDVARGAVTAVRMKDEDPEIALGLGLAHDAGAFTFAPAAIEGTPLAGSLDELLARARSRAAAAREIRASVPSDDVHFRLS